MLVTICQNLVTGRYHPFVWYEAPLPSDDGTEPVVRFRSKFHHTVGFETLDAARAAVDREVVPYVELAYDCVVECRLDPVMPDRWGVGEIPASVVFMRRIDRSAGKEATCLPT